MMITPNLMKKKEEKKDYGYDNKKDDDYSYGKVEKKEYDDYSKSYEKKRGKERLRIR